MDFSWVCNGGTGTCTASADLVSWATNALEGIWFLGGAVIAAVVVMTVAIVFFARLRG